jgi:hypothetical protein
MCDIRASLIDTLTNEQAVSPPPPHHNRRDLRPGFFERAIRVLV